MRTTRRLRRELENHEARVARFEQELAVARERAQIQKDKASRAWNTTGRRKEQWLAAKNRLAILEREASQVNAARRSERVTPSFRHQYHDMRRTTQRAVRIDPEEWHPYRQLKRKLRNYQFAASHGVTIPRVHAVWDDLGEINLESLPETFVLKSDFGSSSRGAYLLRRVAPGRYETLDGHTAMTVEDLRAALLPHLISTRVRGPFFAEELLVEPDGGTIPTDVKIYTCYGHIAQVILRNVTDLHDPETRTMHYLDADGADLGEVTSVHHIDYGVRPPSGLADLLDAARHLSRALGTPFCRIDLYSTTRGIVLGELPLTPGGPQVYSPEHDVRMGLVWQDAQVHRDLDLAHGRPFGILYGSHPVPAFYPPDHISRSVDPGPWSATAVSCEEWCVARDQTTRREPAGLALEWLP